jgi:disulfide bond formation protein DsbB
MWVEVAKPVTLVFCILSLYAVFDAAFLSLSIDLHQKIYESLLRVALAALTSVISGLIFRDAAPRPQRSALVTTLPMQIFCWAASIMLILFVVSWYLETHCIFYRDIRF